MKTITTVGELRAALKPFKYDDVVIIEDTDDNGDAMDRHKFYVAVLFSREETKPTQYGVTSWSTTAEVRLCKIPNKSPDVWNIAPVQRDEVLQSLDRINNLAKRIEELTRELESGTNELMRLSHDGDNNKW